MNRERVLVVAVLAIVLLYALVIRDPPRAADAAESGRHAAKLRDVASPDYTIRRAPFREPGAFTRVTNERPHPRAALDAPAPRELPGLWPPTSRSLSIDRLGRLRRPGAPPAEG
ncbi:MAG: hypothetical protein ACREID_06130, partial [Planctomycetota bacterium]